MRNAVPNDVVPQKEAAGAAHWRSSLRTRIALWAGLVNVALLLLLVLGTAWFARRLILDEPTAGVDIEIRRDMWRVLREINAAGTTIILTTHYLEEAEMLCRNIGIIQRGELVENTSMKALLAKLKSETFILDLAPKSPLPKLDGYQYRLVDTATLEVEVLREQGINSVFTQLSEQGIQVLSMRNKANRLEELFVSLVHEKQGDKA